MESKTPKKEKEKETLGKLVVLEGLDRSGKTTQATQLLANLQAKGISCKYIKFPDRNTTIGRLLNVYLSMSEEKQNPQVIHLLFAANRFELNMEADLKQHQVVIVDRYSDSGVAYSMAKGLCREWCEKIEEPLPKPDLVIYLQIEAEVASKRSAFGAERYETLEFQKLVAKNYELLKKTPLWVTMNATLSTSQLETDILALVSSRFSLT